MNTTPSTPLPHPQGEQPSVEEFSATAETFAGRVHVEWDSDGLVTPLGQLPFFVEYLKQAGLFAGWVADCPLTFSSPNAPSKHDLLGTVAHDLQMSPPSRRTPPPMVVHLPGEAKASKELCSCPANAPIRPIPAITNCRIFQGFEASRGLHPCLLRLRAPGGVR